MLDRLRAVTTCLSRCMAGGFVSTEDWRLMRKNFGEGVGFVPRGAGSGYRVGLCASRKAPVRAGGNQSPTAMRECGSQDAVSSRLGITCCGLPGLQTIGAGIPTLTPSPTDG